MNGSSSQISPKFYQSPDFIKNVVIGLLVVGVIVLIAICAWLATENANCKKASGLSSEEVRKLSAELKICKDESQNLNNQLLKSKDDLKQYKDRTTQLETAAAEHNKRFIEITQSVRLIENYILKKAEVTGFDNRLDQLESSFRALINAQQVAPDQMTTLDFLAYKVYKMLELNAQLKSQINELQQSLNTCNTEKADLRKQLDKVTSDYNTMESITIKTNALVARAQREEKETGIFRLTSEELTFINSSRDYYRTNPPQKNDNNYVYYLLLTFMFEESQKMAAKMRPIMSVAMVQ